VTDPRPYFIDQDAAYALPAATAGVVAIDTVSGDDLTGPHPYGLIAQEADGSLTFAIPGTDDGIEWVEDFDVFPISTPLGNVARGIWGAYSTFKTTSGAPLGSYKIARVVGHSRGCCMALLASAEYGWPCHLFAPPRLVGSAVVAKTSLLSAWHVDGDPVPDFAPGWAEIPGVQRITAPAGVEPWDIAAHHEFRTYKAAISAFYASFP